MKLQQQQTDIEWMILKEVCKRSGQTEDAFREYMKRGDWVNGVHWVKRKDRIWIQIKEFNNWVSTGE